MYGTPFENIDNLDPAKTALLIIDMQKAFVEPGAVLCVKGAKDTVPACAAALKDARRLGIKVIWIKREYREDGSDMEIPRRRQLERAGVTGVLAPGSTGINSVEEPEGLIRAEDEMVIVKPRWSAFFETGLNDVLKSSGIDTVLLAGTTTPNCIRTTCYDAIAYDFRTIVLARCTSSQTGEIQRANLEDMRTAGAQIVPEMHVIFDMDGVIFDTERFYLECCVPAAEKVGLARMEEVARQCIGLTEPETEKRLRAFYGEDAPLEEFHQETGRIFMERYAKAGLPLKEGAVELLRYLKEQGARIALASSTRLDIITMEMRDAGLIDYFDVIIGGDMVKNSKPQPDVFLRAAEELNVDAADCYIIEDSYNGVRAARKAGGTVFMVPDLLEPTEEMRSLADRIFGSLLDVKKYLQGE